MLIEQIRQDMIAAKKSGDSIEKSLLVTLFAEASRVGKDRRNGDTTDDEAIGVIKKFAANVEETIKLLVDRGQPADAQRKELSILQAYLPQQLSQAELVKAISDIVAEQPEKGPKAMGKVMAELKARYGATYDGKIASALVKSALA